MFAYHDKTALVTGASSGIGRAFAHALAARGAHLILLARSEETLQALAADLTSRYGIRAEVVVANLSKPGDARRAFEEVERRGLTVDLLINNAGFASYGRFEDIAPERDQAQVMVNVAAVVELAHACLPGMLARGNGAVINVASIVGYWPGPYESVYAASKAFVLSFSQALAAEYRGRGVRVVALCPGSTATNWFAAANAETLAARSAVLGAMRSPEQVAATGLRALEDGRSLAVDGRANAVFTLLLRFFPPMFLARATERFIRPR